LNGLRHNCPLRLIDKRVNFIGLEQQLNMVQRGDPIASMPKQSFKEKQRQQQQRRSIALDLCACVCVSVNCQDCMNGNGRQVDHRTENRSTTVQNDISSRMLLSHRSNNNVPDGYGHDTNRCLMEMDKYNKAELA
ncbi:hypothetical protein RDWZM_007549, partial [Blomia tropicalis]